MALDFTERLWALLPRGPIWEARAGSNLRKLLTALAQEPSRAYQRDQDLLAEMDPRTTTELISDWERVVGLPDSCLAEVPTDLQERRDLVTARWVKRGAAAGGVSGGPDVSFLNGLIGEMGWGPTEYLIRRFHRQPFNCQSQCTDPLNTADAGWRYVYEVIAKHRTAELDHYLRCQIEERYGLSGIEWVFAFPLVFDNTSGAMGGMFARDSTAILYTQPSGNASALAVDEPGTFYFGV